MIVEKLRFCLQSQFTNSQFFTIHFTTLRKGISRQVLGEFLGSGTEKTKKILKSLCNEIDLSNLDVDEALRKFQSHIRIQVSKVGCILPIVIWSEFRLRKHTTIIGKTHPTLTGQGLGEIPRNFKIFNL